VSPPPESLQPSTTARAQPQPEAAAAPEVPAVAPEAAPVSAEAGVAKIAEAPATPASKPETSAPLEAKPTKPAAGGAPTHRGESVAPKPAPSAPAQVPQVAAAPVSAAPYQVEPNGRMSFLIDAPLEKIKGSWSRTGGQFKVNPEKLEQTRGEVTMDLSTLKISTFTDASQNESQGRHALNWMEIGDEVAADTRARFRTATFRIDNVVSATPPALADGALQTRAVLEGTMTLHGITSTHRVEVEVVAEGDPKAPTSLRVTSKKPIRLSLKHHDIKPRDLAGRFLSGALEQVGQKISDTVQVSFDFKAIRQ
jgi:polyisoprenoid-binding protein YceI